MTHFEQPDYYKRLDKAEIKAAISDWAKNYPCVDNIRLYRHDMDKDIPNDPKYVFVVVAPKFQSKSDQELDKEAEPKDEIQIAGRGAFEQEELDLVNRVVGEINAILGKEGVKGFDGELDLIQQHRLSGLSSDIQTIQRYAQRKSKTIEQYLGALEVNPTVAGIIARQLAQDIIKYYNETDVDCSHIHHLVEDFYINDPPENYRDEWFWFSIEPGEHITDYQLVMEIEPFVLYERTDKRQRRREAGQLDMPRTLDEEIEDLMREAQPQLEGLYEVTHTAGFSKDIALAEIRKNREFYTFIKEEYLNISGLFNSPERGERRFVGKLLKKIVNSKHPGSYDYQKLLKTYSNLFKGA